MDTQGGTPFPFDLNAEAPDATTAPNPAAGEHIQGIEQPMIGNNGLSHETLLMARIELQYAAACGTTRVYSDNIGVFEAINMPSCNCSAARTLVDMWLNNPYNNVWRVYNSLGRLIPNIPEVVEYYGAMIINPTGQRAHLSRGFIGRPGIWVMIPLDPWTIENGLWFDDLVAAGQDFAIDGTQPVTLTGAGGCFILLIKLA